MRIHPLVLCCPQAECDRGGTGKIHSEELRRSPKDTATLILWESPPQGDAVGILIMHLLWLFWIRKEKSASTWARTRLPRTSQSVFAIPAGTTPPDHFGSTSNSASCIGGGRICFECSLIARPCATMPSRSRPISYRLSRKAVPFPDRRSQ